MDTRINVSLGVYAYCVLLGVSYMWGYWLPFDLNILAFADVSDIIKSSVYPLLPTLAVGVSWFAFQSFGNVEAGTIRYALSQGGWDRKIMLAFLTVIFLWALFGFVMLLKPIFLEDGYRKLIGVYPVVGLLFALLLQSNKKILPGDERIRFFLICIACLSPSGAFISGLRQGEEALNTVPPYWVVEARSPCPGLSEEVILLSRLSGKYVVLGRSSKRICVLSDEGVTLTRVTASQKAAP